MVLQFITITAQGCVRVEMKRSQGKLSRRELMITQYGFATVPFVFITIVRPQRPMTTDH